MGVTHASELAIHWIDRYCTDRQASQLLISRLILQCYILGRLKSKLAPSFKQRLLREWEALRPRVERSLSWLFFQRNWNYSLPSMAPGKALNNLLKISLSQQALQKQNTSTQLYLFLLIDFLNKLKILSPLYGSRTYNSC